MTEETVEYQTTVQTSNQIVCCQRCGELLGVNEDGILRIGVKWEGGKPFGGLLVYNLKDAECAYCNQKFFWQWPFKRVRQPR